MYLLKGMHFKKAQGAMATLFLYMSPMTTIAGQTTLFIIIIKLVQHILGSDAG